MGHAKGRNEERNGGRMGHSLGKLDLETGRGNDD